MIELQARIESGTLTPGSRLPAERTLAEEFLVSRAIVRATIQKLVEDGLLDQKPNCRPTVRFTAAKAETARKTGRIAVWMPSDDQDVGAPLILNGIRRVAAKAERQLVVTGHGNECSESIIEFLRSVQDDPEIDGLIIWTSDDPALVPAYQKLIEADFPLVFIDRDPPEPIDADVVAVDHYRGARAATQHLLKLGHRQIAMIANDDRVSSVRERIDGYHSVLREAGVAPREELLTEVAWVHGRDLAASIENIVDHLLGLETPPTAVFAVNDQIAMYAQEAFARRGVRVPQEISLAGFDWFLRWLPSGGELTTVAQPFEEIGAAAASRLIERLRSSGPHVPHRLLLPARLVAKASTKTPGPLAALAAPVISTEHFHES